MERHVQTIASVGQAERHGLAWVECIYKFNARLIGNGSDAKFEPA
jgi:hypothetical protein